MCDKQDQLDEVEFLQAMSKDSEFQWEEHPQTGLISGTLNISVKLDQPICLKFIKPVKERQSVPVAGATPLQPPALAKRSDSCSKEKCATVEHLPPFLLHFEFPLTYPSSAMPDYTLTCQWLNFSQLSVLCKALDGVWSESGGAVVLYNWQQLLSDEVFSTLGLDSFPDIVLQYQDPRVTSQDWDSRAVQDITNPNLLIPSLIEYNDRQKLLVFNESFFDCEVCYIAKQGLRCAKIASCDHVYCRECLSVYLKTKVTDGEVTKMECPTCSTIIQPSLIRELLSLDDFNRYDKLLLQRTLEGMMDITYCPLPSCGCATVQEPDSNMAQCPRCSFSFCVLCKHSWHGAGSCKLLPQDLKDLHEIWGTLEESEKKSLAQQYGGRRKLELAFQEYESLKWVDKNSKPCPICTAHIQKTDGCNKMTCTKCGNNFCWLCDSRLPKHNPYSHFKIVLNNKSPCVGKLFAGLEVFDDDDF